MEQGEGKIQERGEDKRVRKKARVSLWVKTVADEELTREKEKNKKTKQPKKAG